MKKHQPKGFKILHDDPDVIVGNKAAGFLTVAALWEKENTIHANLNSYVRKGSEYSKKSVYVVHRLDQATSGVLMFAKTPEAKAFLQDNWKTTEKTYYAIVHGCPLKKTATISSYLSEDEDYLVHSSSNSQCGKLAITEYTVVKEAGKFSVLKIKLITGKKNQIRVHLAAEGHPIVGDVKYGGANLSTHKNLMLHSYSVEFTHPFNKRRVRVQAEVPDYFQRLADHQFKY